MFLTRKIKKNINNKKKTKNKHLNAVCESTERFDQHYTVFELGETQRLTSTDNLLDLDKGNINFLGKLSHCLIRVLIGEGVDINLDP